MQGVQESLAGRVALLHLSPLSQQEIYKGQPGAFRLELETLQKKEAVTSAITTPQVFERIFSGGMPALVSKKYDDRSVFYSGNLSTCLERDVRELSGSIITCSSAPLKRQNCIFMIPGWCAILPNGAVPKLL